MKPNLKTILLLTAALLSGCEVKFRNDTDIAKLQEASYKEGVQAGINFSLQWYIEHNLSLGELPIETASEKCWSNRKTK